RRARPAAGTAGGQAARRAARRSRPRPAAADPRARASAGRAGVPRLCSGRRGVQATAARSSAGACCPSRPRPARDTRRARSPPRQGPRAAGGWRCARGRTCRTGTRSSLASAYLEPLGRLAGEPHDVGAVAQAQLELADAEERVLEQPAVVADQVGDEADGDRLEADDEEHRAEDQALYVAGAVAEEIEDEEA